MTATIPETTGLTGQMLIAGEPVRGSGKPINAFDPTAGETLEPAYHYGDSSNVDAACAAAAEAFPVYRATTSEQRAQFLEAIAANIEAVKDAIIARATAESGLPTARITGEVGRTTGQLRLFASVLREGSWNGARIDPALPDRQPAPRPDIRQRIVPLGPVAVFGASNFPLAFSVAGGDTASALAAGCPVVVKGHDAHPGTSELVGRAITDAVAESGLPKGTFSLLFGSGPDLGIALVTDPRIKAVGFTGSRSGGTALVAAAAGRPEPIPVYAEMSSINPVFLLDGALSTRGAELGKAFVGSLTMGSGQFCTNPGLVIAADGPGLDDFITAARDALAGSPATPMLTPNIASSYADGVTALSKEADLIGRGEASDNETSCRAALFATDASSFLNSEGLQAEVFGSSSLIVRCNDAAEMQHASPRTSKASSPRPCTPTSPTTTTPRSCCRSSNSRPAASCSTAGPPASRSATPWSTAAPTPPPPTRAAPPSARCAIERFLRPVAYQDVPKSLLPSAIADGNPDHLWRRIDGQLTAD